MSMSLGRKAQDQPNSHEPRSGEGELSLARARFDLIPAAGLRPRRYAVACAARYKGISQLLNRRASMEIRTTKPDFKPGHIAAIALSSACFSCLHSANLDKFSPRSAPSRTIRRRIDDRVR